MTAHIRKKRFADCSDWITAEGEAKKNNKIIKNMPIARRAIIFVGGQNIPVPDLRIHYY
jgi:hypothetical protein